MRAASEQIENRKQTRPPQGGRVLCWRMLLTDAEPGGSLGMITDAGINVATDARRGTRRRGAAAARTTQQRNANEDQSQQGEDAFHAVQPAKVSPAESRLFPRHFLFPKIPQPFMAIYSSVP